MAYIYGYGVQHKISYVGYTSKPLRERLAEHWRGDGTNHKTRLAIKRWKKRKLKPFIIMLERIDPREWQDKERFWIRLLRERGHKLLNITDGGAGTPGLQHTEATRQQMREAHLGHEHSEETKRLLSFKLAGEKAPKAKLTPTQIVEIRASSESGSTLARKYGVHPAQITRVRRGSTWRHTA